MKNNLYNETDKKTKKTIEYIKLLEPSIEMVDTEQSNFYKLKEIALSKDSANAMLDYIGYNLEGEDMIYQKARINRKVI